MSNLLQEKIGKTKNKWLVSGAAGFIGSHIVEQLLNLEQKVIGIDNFSTGHKKNLTQMLESVPKKLQRNFQFQKIDIRNAKDCKKTLKKTDFVLHQAALGSVPRSILDPISSFESNILGYNNLIFAAKEAKVRKFVYASSSSVYGDHPALPKKEENMGKLLSPYALTKYVNERTADVFQRSYGIECIGLRYFNVFGARQDPEGPYAAVIPLWIKDMMKNRPIYINGDGETSRDFCYVANVVQANILAALSENPLASGRSYNISCGNKTTLNQLYEMLRTMLLNDFPKLKNHSATKRAFREGDIRHSMADISAAQKALDFKPTHQIREGLEIALNWYKSNL